MKALFLIISLTLFVAAKEIKNDKKLIMVFTHMKYCSWCKKMQEEIIDNKQALKELNRYYVLTKIKRESGNMPSFLHPNLFPTTYILSTDGNNIIEEIEGYMSKDKFLKYIKNAYEIEMDDTSLE
jgi:thioredoxin-related protein